MLDLKTASSNYFRTNNDVIITTNRCYSVFRSRADLNALMTPRFTSLNELQTHKSILNVFMIQFHKDNLGMKTPKRPLYAETILC